VARQEVGRLTKVPGIGTKTAERLLLELKGKLADALPASVRLPVADSQHDILNALLALGYNDREAGAAMKQLPPTSPPPTAFGRRSSCCQKSESTMNPGHKQLIQIALVALLLIGCIAVLLPFTGTLLFAIVICVTTLPIRNRLLTLCGGRSNLAALLVSILLLLVLVARWPCSRDRSPTASRSPFATSSR
jgi:hypothetical protein